MVLLFNTKDKYSMPDITQSIWSGLLQWLITPVETNVFQPKGIDTLHLLEDLLTLVLLNPDISCFANSVDPDQLASEEANWSGSALFAIKYANL